MSKSTISKIGVQDLSKQKKNKESFNKGKQQWADHLTEKAKHDNYPARSVYKLIEIQKKFNILKKGDNILDLGCAPGSWLIYAAKTIGNKGIAIGIDLQKIQIQLPSNAFPIKGDVFNINQDSSFGLIGSIGSNSSITNQNQLNNSQLNIVKKYDVILSDMAPSTTGRKDVDAARSFELCESALKIASEWLQIGGNFVCKIFQGSEFKHFEQHVKTKFKQTSVFKPDSCRSASKEIYIIGKEKM